MIYFDGKNPYGSKGGYVRDREMEDMRRGRDRASDYYGDYAMDGRDYYSDGADYSRDMYRRRGMDGHYPMVDPYLYMMGQQYPQMDYAQHNKKKYLPEEELRKWSSRLMREIGEKESLKMDSIMKRAESLSIEFEKFSPQEFYTTMLMIYSDYHKTLGTANVDLYLKLAKDWLCDEDAEVRYGEKLAAYYYSVVKGV